MPFRYMPHLHTRRIAWSLIIIGLGVCPTIHGRSHKQKDTRVQALAKLRERLHQHPEDVDTRLQLASMLSWQNKPDEARKHAERVIHQVPIYWDAHLLVARLDAWDGRYEESMKRLLKILPRLKNPDVAYRLLAKVAVWRRKPSKSVPLLRRLVKKRPTAAMYFALATVEHQAMKHLAAYRTAGVVLRSDPTHIHATKMRRNIALATVDFGYEFEAYPSLTGDARFAHGTVISATFLPRSWLSVTLVEEYRRRFATDNNRITGQIDWRITPRMQVTAFAALGLPARVISTAAAGASLLFPLVSIINGSIGYVYDRPSWGGNLHRVNVGTGARLPAGMRVEAAYNLGLLARCATVDVLHGVLTRLYGEWGPILAYAQYAFGMELDRPVLPAGIRNLYTGEGCARPASELPAGISAPAATFPLNELKAHTLASQIRYRISRRWMIKGGYGIQLRFNGTRVHSSQLGLRTTF